MDILQNLVANTRMEQSAARMALQLAHPCCCGSVVDRNQPLERLSAWQRQCVVVDSGWSHVDVCAGM